MPMSDSEFFRDLVENTNDLIARFDNRGRFFYVSPSAESVFGIPPSECIGKRALSFLASNERYETMQKVKQWVKDGVSNATLETRQMNADGGVRHMMWTINLHYDDNRNLTGINSIGRDITRMKIAEEELRNSEEMWNQLFMASPTWIILATVEEGYFLDFNDAFCRDTGYQKNEVIGRTTVEIGLWEHPEDRDRVLRKIKTEGGLDKFPLRLRMRDGEFRDFLWSTVIIEVHGKECLLSVLVDVGDLKRTQKQLAKTNRELEKRSNDLAEMNSALKVLLKQRDEDKKNLESRVWHNIKKMIQPHLHNLRMSGLNPTQAAHLDVAVSRLEDISSSMGQRLGRQAYGLTARELEVVGHIAEGKTNKDIAELLCISVHSVESHRFSIRKKLGLLGKRINLRTHLLAMSK